MKAYTIREVSNGWLVESDGMWVGADKDEYLPGMPVTYAGTIGEVFELIRKNVKDSGKKS